MATEPGPARTRAPSTPERRRTRLVEGAGAGLAAAFGLVLAGWLALPGYMAGAWEAPSWPEVALRTATGPVTYGAPSWGKAPVLEPQTAALPIPNPAADAEADVRRIEAETERFMASERENFARIQAAAAAENALETPALETTPVKLGVSADGKPQGEPVSAVLETSATVSP